MKSILLFLILSAPVAAENATVRVLSVHDADTIVVRHKGRAETIRLKGIDCPERGESKSLRAKKYASEMLQNKNVTLKAYGTDKYGRTIADLFLDNGNLFNKELVLSGNCKWGRSRAMRQ